MRHRPPQHCGGLRRPRLIPARRPWLHPVAHALRVPVTASAEPGLLLAGAAPCRGRVVASHSPLASVAHEVGAARSVLGMRCATALTPARRSARRPRHRGRPQWLSDGRNTRAGVGATPPRIPRSTRPRRGRIPGCVLLDPARSGMVQRSLHHLSSNPRGSRHRTLPAPASSKRQSFGPHGTAGNWAGTAGTNSNRRHTPPRAGPPTPRPWRMSGPTKTCRESRLHRVSRGRRSHHRSRRRSSACRRAP